jgi:hypothetical protein
MSKQPKLVWRLIVPDEIEIVSNEDDAGFLPAVAPDGITLPGKLGEPYQAVRNAAKSTHDSVRALWGAVYEFSITCIRDENRAAFETGCQDNSITARKGTSRFNRAVKLAIGKPVWKEELDKVVLEVDDVQVFRFCKAFDVAFDEGVTSGPEFVHWINNPEQGGGSIQAAVERGTKSKLVFAKTEPKDADRFVALNNLRSRMQEEFPDFTPSFDGKIGDGHYQIVVTVQDGKPVLDYVEELENEEFDHVIVKSSYSEDWPRDILATLKELKKVTAGFVLTTARINDGQCSYEGEDKDGVQYPSKTFPVLDSIPEANFSISKEMMVELAKCFSVFKGLKWKLLSKGGGTIQISMPVNSNLDDVLEKFNSSTSNKKSFDPKIVKQLKSGTIVEMKLAAKVN